MKRMGRAGIVHQIIRPPGQGQSKRAKAAQRRKTAGAGASAGSPAPGGGGGGRKGKGKDRKGKGKRGQSCFGYGRGRDGPCVGLAKGEACLVGMSHHCEFCSSTDHKSKDCPQKPAGVVW